jgi:hypothetical protein
MPTTLRFAETEADRAAIQSKLAVRFLLNLARIAGLKLADRDRAEH